MLAMPHLLLHLLHNIVETKHTVTKGQIGIVFVVHQTGQLTRPVVDAVVAAIPRRLSTVSANLASLPPPLPSTLPSRSCYSLGLPMSKEEVNRQAIIGLLNESADIVSAEAKAKFAKGKALKEKKKTLRDLAARGDELSAKTVAKLMEAH